MAATASNTQGECPRCAERDRRIADLEAHLARIEAELAKARKNSGNSSKPPSSDIVRPSATRERKVGRPRRRKRGGQPGHPRHLRTPLPPESVDEIIEYRYDVCPGCGGRLHDAHEPPKILQQVELAPKLVTVEEHRQIAQYCRRCNEVHYHPLGLALRNAGLCGPQLTALVGFFKGACHMSFSTIRRFFRDVMNENVLLQFCLAHFIRDVKFLAEHPDRQNRNYGERLLERLKKLFATIHRRGEFASDATFQRALVRIENDLVWEATVESPHTQEALNLEERFYRHTESYFRFIVHPEIEPTNNLAERTLRFVAIHRRITQGTRGEAGQRWRERICTAIATCAQQGRSVFHFLREAVAEHLAGQPPPLLASAGS